MDDELYRARPGEALSELVRREWGLPAGDARDLGGSYNLNLLVAGSCVVRVYGPWVSASRLAAVQAVRSALRERGWPIPSLRLTGAGAGFARLGNRLVEVEAYVSGGSAMSSWDSLEAGVPWLARLHDALGTLAFSPAAASPPVANHLDAGRVLADTSEALEAIRGWASTPDELRYLAVAEGAVAAFAGVPSFDLPVQLVHGDFWHENVGLEGSSLVRLGDFDFIGVRPRIDDLALTLFFANEQHGRDDLSTGRLDQLRRLVDRYDAALAVPLSSAERAALPYAIARSPLTFLRDLADGEPFHRAELVELRGPEYAWALRVLDDPRWLDLA